MRHFDVLKLLIHNSSPLSQSLPGPQKYFLSFEFVILPTLYVRVVYEYHFEFQTICLASLATV